MRQRHGQRQPDNTVAIGSPADIVIFWARDKGVISGSSTGLGIQFSLDIGQRARDKGVLRARSSSIHESLCVTCLHLVEA